jgi:hypothetical protein
MAAEIDRFEELEDVRAPALDRSIARSIRAHDNPLRHGETSSASVE